MPSAGPPIRMSAVAAGLLGTAGFQPRRVCGAIARRRAAGGWSRLGPSSYHVRTVRATTGFPLVGFSSNHRNLLLEALSLNPYWRYIELGRTDCALYSASRFADTVLRGVVGAPLSAIAPNLGMLSAFPIVAAVDGFHGAEFRIAPSWSIIP